eukprot:m.1331685 g.1331685  ORF g.1331685 m.1331685 type:complete len:69 (+) comp24866_c0_seq6:2363-2569(+)
MEMDDVRAWCLRVCMPVGPDCFGIMYTLTGEQAMAGVISYQRGTAEFLEHLQGSLDDIRAALDYSVPA